MGTSNFHFEIIIAQFNFGSEAKAKMMFRKKENGTKTSYSCLQYLSLFSRKFSSTSDCVRAVKFSDIASRTVQLRLNYTSRANLNFKRFYLTV